MTARALNTRLAKLEERAGAQGEDGRPVHLLSAYSEAEQADKVAALINSGVAQATNFFIVLTPLRRAGE